MGERAANGRMGADGHMPLKVLLVGDGTPASSALALRAGASAVAEVTFVDVARLGLLDGLSPIPSLRVRRGARRAGARLIEAVGHLDPDVVMLVEGRGLDAATLHEVRALGTPVSVYFPDNPCWRNGDRVNPLARLRAADQVAVPCKRFVGLLDEQIARTDIVPLGYDPDRFPLTVPGGTRYGLAFVGGHTRRRERFLASLEGLPLVVHGRGWEQSKLAPHVAAAGVTEAEVLQAAAIAVNLLHPRHASGHNHQTREIAASGALQLTEPGTDGTPLRDGESCVWFRTPEGLRKSADLLMAERAAGVEIAATAQALIAPDTWIAHALALMAMVPKTTFAASSCR